MRGPEIIPANNVFRGVVKEIRGAGNDKPTQHPRISPEDQCIFKHSAAVRPDNPKAFVSKVWSDIQLHFGHGGKEGYQDLKPESLILKCDNVGEKYFTMNRNNKSWRSDGERRRKPEGCHVWGSRKCALVYCSSPLSEPVVKDLTQVVQGSTCVLHQPQPENHCYAETVWCGARGKS